METLRYEFNDQSGLWEISVAIVDDEGATDWFKVGEECQEATANTIINLLKEWKKQ